MIAKADVCLGIFGRTEKASRVIPYKVYEALAMKKPVITGDSPAAREILHDQVHVLLSPMGEPEALAQRILRLREDPELRRRIAEEGHRLFHAKCSSQKMAEAIIQDLARRGPGLIPRGIKGAGGSA
jgi:glycosyltransferase involved in cell wall biosynthesis